MSTPTTPPRANLPLPQSTPFKTGSSTTLAYTTTQKYRIESCAALADEMKPYLVGPMPAQQFLDDFFPADNILGLDEVPAFSSDCYKETVQAPGERDAYEPFVKATQKFTPGLQVVNSSNSDDRNPRLDFPFKIKPDVSVYRFDRSIPVLTDSSLAEIFIEFKWQTSDDPFCTPYDHPTVPNARSFLREVKGARDTLGQITSYAVAQLGSQFRTHLYSVFIVKDEARLLRWDRSGTIVTEPIEYNRSPLLVEFFRRYSKASPEMCGRDQSVTAVTPEEAHVAREALQLKSEVPLVKLAITVANQQPSRCFVTDAPHATLYTPPGRATRGFCAYDFSQGTMVFLKDSWRIDLPDIHMEGSTYGKLEHYGVPNIPRCLVSGDISTNKYHATKTNNYSSSSWACHSDAHFVPHRHYRLVLDLIGDPLTKFRSSYELVGAIRDALVAHEAACCAGILHRDISPGNIIIGPDRRGWLIDWDLSKPTQENRQETPRRATRTGTWQFMSASLIRGDSKQQDYKDDLESFLYTLLWVTLMYSESPDPDLAYSILTSIFEPHPEVTRSIAKADFLKGRSYLVDAYFPRRAVLVTLFDKLAKMFATRHLEAPSLDERRQIVDGTASPITVGQVFAYDQGMSGLSNHRATIDLFEAALVDASTWPAHDTAKKQFHNSKKAADQKEVKSGWNTPLFVNLLAKPSDAPNENQMDDV